MGDQWPGEAPEDEDVQDEAEVHPHGSTRLVRPGPYRFASATDAFRFVQESLLALQYLGCAVGPDA